MLLRAAIVTYWQAAAKVPSSQTPVKFEWLRRVLEGLNLNLKAQLFGSSQRLARLAANDAASGTDPRSAGTSAATCSAAAVQNVKTVAVALKVGMLVSFWPRFTYVIGAFSQGCPGLAKRAQEGPRPRGV